LVINIQHALMNNASHFPLKMRNGGQAKEAMLFDELGLVAYALELPPDSFLTHIHPKAIHFLFCIQGLAIVQLEDNTYQLLPGDCLLVPQGIAHSLGAKQANTVMLVVNTGVNPGDPEHTIETELEVKGEE
jgi:mannose-6-phosphate isomerase-like protein (cupin superfamily)